MSDLEIGTQTANSVDTNKPGGREKRTELVKVRLTPTEVYLLKDADRKLGYLNVSTTLRWMIAHFGEIEQSRQMVERFKAWKAARAELDKTVV